MTKRPANIVFDFGGVLMQHDRQGCLLALQQLLSDEDITNVLGGPGPGPRRPAHRRAGRQ